jgi:hypothetical protein
VGSGKEWTRSVTGSEARPVALPANSSEQVYPDAVRTVKGLCYTLWL